MPEYLSPGVYVEEIDRGPKPIEGVPTSTAAFLGELERGPIEPRLVTSYEHFERWFGGVFAADKYVPHAMRGFFDNGGTRAFVCRLVGRDARTAQAAFGDFVVRAAGPGSWGNRVFVRIEDGTTRKPDGTSVGFRLRVAYWNAGRPEFDPFLDPMREPRPSCTEDFDDLATDESSPRFYQKRVPFLDRARGGTMHGWGRAALFVLVRRADAAADSRPAYGVHGLDGGADDPRSALIESDYVGHPVGDRIHPQGLAALELPPYRDVSLITAPNASVGVAKTIVAHCEKMRFRVAAIDCAEGTSRVADLDPRGAIADSSHAAFYYPWIAIAHPITGTRTLVPPGGHVLGVYARTDAERGVFKAPANEIVRGAIELEYPVADAVQDDLNPKGVNVIRSFPGRGIRVWGARTITSNPTWKYVNVRRLFIFLERSIQEGTRWVVFEPNGERLWAQVVDVIRVFLRSQWKLGALLGRTEREAFFVTCGRTTMSEDDIANGRLVCEIGVALMRPAEFVIFRIAQKTAEA